MITVEWPVHLEANNNTREHWKARQRRTKKQRLETALMLRANRVADRLGVCKKDRRLTVTFLRISPRSLDPGDNLNSAFKPIRDEIAAYFHVNDGNERALRFIYAPQEHGPTNCRVTFAWEKYKAPKPSPAPRISKALKKAGLSTGVVSYR